MIQTNAISIAIASAQPISRPFDFHPDINLDDRYSLSIMMPIPNDVEASVKIARCDIGGGAAIDEPMSTLESVLIHHSASASARDVAGLRMNRRLCERGKVG